MRPPNDREDMSLTPRIEQCIARLFLPADQERVRTALLEECGTNIPGWESAGLERLRLAVLKFSEGKLNRFFGAIDVAKQDFRDTLMAAGFGDVDSHKRWLPSSRLHK